MKLKELVSRITFLSSLAILNKETLAQSSNSSGKITVNIASTVSKEELQKFLKSSNKIQFKQNIKPGTGKFEIDKNEFELVLHKKDENKIVSITLSNSKSKTIQFVIVPDSIYRFFIVVDNIRTEVFLESNLILFGDYRSRNSPCFESIRYVSFSEKKIKSSHGHCSHYSSSPK